MSPDLSPPHTTSCPLARPGPLADPEQVPLLGPDVLARWGRTVVVAPHPDDESLGCGGLIASLATAGRPPRVVVVTDGSRSHPNSPSYPAARLRALREAEARAALAALGVDPSSAIFLGLPDCGVPHPGDAGYLRAVAQTAVAFDAWSPDTLVIPWRRDPHCDHEATWSLFRAVAAVSALPVRIVEYPVWAWTRPAGPEAPSPGEVRAWRLDVRAVEDRKARAIAAHRSQTTRMIDDDPDGFILSPDVLAHFARPYEMFFEARA